MLISESPLYKDLATPKFGKLMFEITVTRFIEMARGLRMIPIKSKMDHH